MTNAEAIYEELVEYNVIDMDTAYKDKNLKQLHGIKRLSDNLIEKLENTNTFKNKMAAREKVERGRLAKEQATKGTRLEITVREDIMKDFKTSIADLNTAEIKEIKIMLQTREKEARGQERSQKEIARLETSIAIMQEKLEKLKKV